MILSEPRLLPIGQCQWRGDKCAGVIIPAILTQLFQWPQAKIWTDGILTLDGKTAVLHDLDGEGGP